MDSIVQKRKFMQITKDDQVDEFVDAVDEWMGENEEKLNVSMITNCLKHIQSQVCNDSYPQEESPQGAMAIRALESTFDALEKTVDNGNASYSKFHDQLYDFMMKLITCGPGSLHIKLIKDIINHSSIEFPEYFKALKGKKVSDLLKALMRKYSTKDKTESSEYADMVESLISRILCSLFEEDHYQEYKDDFYAVYEYFKSNPDNTDKNIKKILKEQADDIERNYDGNIFKSVTDVKKLTAEIDKLAKIVAEANFPQNEEDGERVRSPLSSLLSVIQENGQLAETYNSLMNLVTAVTKKKQDAVLQKIVEEIGYYFYHVDETSNHIKNNDKLFKEVIKKLIELLQGITDSYYLSVKLVDAIISEILVKSMSKSKEHVTSAIDLVKNLLKFPTIQCVGGAYDMIYENEKFYKWKEHLPAAQEIFKIISAVKADNEEVIEKYVSFTETFLDQLKKNKALAEINEGMVYFSLGCLELRNESLFSLGSEVSEKCKFDFKKTRNLIFEVLEKLKTLFNDTDFPWDDSNSSSIVQNLLPACLSALDNQGKQLTDEERQTLVDITLSTVDKDFNHAITGEPGSVFYTSFVQLGMKLIDFLDKDIDRIEPVIPHLFNLLESDEEDVVSMVNSIVFMIAQKTGKPFAPDLERLILKLLDSEDYNLMSAVSGAYDYNTKALHKHFQDMLKFTDSGDTALKSYFFMFLEKVAKTDVELFTKKNVEDLIAACTDDVNNQVVVLRVLEEIAKQKYDKISSFTKKIMELDGKLQQWSIYSLTCVLKWIGMQDKKQTEPIMIYLTKKLEEPEDQTITYGVLDAMKQIGARERPVLEKYRGSIESLKERTANQTTKDICTSIIDMLEGRSLEGLEDDIGKVSEDVTQLDTRVTVNENNINEVKTDVKKTKEDVKIVKKDVKDQGQKLDDMGKVVDETVQKVEEIDQKTLSHAPYWSRDISKLLNPKDEHDWRLLSSRLGYSNDDIRAWSQQSDPCMAMLNEWYTTHKTSEANYGVLNALQEMNRMDAAVIVENAMKAAEQVVEDEDFEYAAPPPIFLSYQWSHQEEVKLLRQHLEMAGYDCWMDIGQMGGGDKLFEKIDKGIRAAKVIISCTTEKYAKSPNCNREVNLSTNLRKPLIPLLLENCTWPPEGSMGPIFSEYLYIKFFQSDASEQTKDDRYWPPPKFQELLMQLSMNGIVPDESKVHKMYKNWWNPLVEEIKINKSKTANGGKNKTVSKQTSNKQEDESPEVFISYQWDKQKNVMLLYKRLTELGYNCWMDIYQMGGGDSLYDKIDRGLRGSKVVLSCLTDKYTLSANCRREVSLSDSLKRPIIPLLLENIQWPPRGPMSMAFTELLYIDLHSDPKVQEKWSGPKFEELQMKIRQILPDEDTSATTNEQSKPSKTQESKSKSTVPATKPADSKQKAQPKPADDKSKPQPKPADTKAKPTDTKSKPAATTQKAQPQATDNPQSKQNEPDPNSNKGGSYVKKATPGTKGKKPSPSPETNNQPETNQPNPTPNTNSSQSPEKKSSNQDKPKSKSCHIL